MSGWQRKTSKHTYKNPWIAVREDQVVHPNGTEGVYAVVETRGPSVLIVALTDQNEVYLIGQHRYTIGEFSWELPGGNSEKQAPKDAAARELQEETGLQASHWVELGRTHPMNGVTNEMQYSFLAKGLTQTNEDKRGEEGILKVKKVRFNDLWAMVKNDELRDGQSITALTLAGLFLGVVPC